MVFASAKIKALVVAGAHRFSGLGIIASPSCPQLGGLAADAAHNVDAIPFAAARATAAHYAALADPSWVVLDLDGMGSTTCDADVYLTLGADAEGGDRLASFQANLEVALPAAVFAQPEAGASPCAEHGGTTTTTGRLLNGVPEADVCTTGYGAGHAIPASGNYVYVAQSVGLLQGKSVNVDNANITFALSYGCVAAILGESPRGGARQTIVAGFRIFLDLPFVVPC